MRAAARVVSAPATRHLWAPLWLLALSLGLVFASPAQAKPLQVSVNSAYIDVYTGPGRGYPIFHVVERGEQITLLKRRTDWIKVETRRGQQGWIQREALRHTLGPDGLPPTMVDPGQSDYLARRFELGVSVGDFAGADSLNASLGYRFTPQLTTELRVGQNTGQYSDSRMATLGLLHQPFPEWRVSPFFGIAAGRIKTLPSATLVEAQDREDNLLQASLGTYVYLSRRFFLRVEYTNHQILTSRETNEEINEWKLGFNVFF
ncbi:SH3 domain-containing protein [Marinimicrobium sp. ABcell2]|uniref:SH3 domain-containing protein n=1 Tax=Marinimicrobium sp. ABcell2 TaxID=3069751 RepID=UPI0027B0435A|nr:SH3 domain-containing protein [Marinimicrobium sp. ABcell2]MDQ2076630.1 SH3 domain-containing protein [Marinimicrobium sp. ABcell2]